MLNRLTDRVLARPKMTILLVLLVTAFFGNAMRGLRADTDLTRDLPQQLPAKALYDRIDEIFPAKEMLVVGIVADDVFTHDGLARLARLTGRIEDLPEVQSAMSPTNARIISSADDQMIVSEAADPLPKTDAEAADIRHRLNGQPLYQGTLVSRDNRAVAILVFIKGGVREVDAAEQILAIADDPQRNEGFVLDVTGRSVAAHWANVIMARDMGMLSSAALLIVILLMVATFRSGRGVLLPLGVVISSIVCTLGLMAQVDFALSHSTEILPTLLIAIGVADGIHILKGYYARARGASDAKEVVRETMRDLNRPVALTSFTTAVGFIALGTSGVGSIMALGLFTAFGVMIAMLFSLTFLPAVLSLLRLPKMTKGAEAGSRFVLMEKAAHGYAGFLVRHKAVLSVAILILVGLATYGATRVVVESSNLANFPAGHPFRLATERVNEHFASTTSLTLVVEGGADAIKDPVVLQKMDDLQSFLRDRPHIGSIQSITGFIKQMHRVMHGGGDEQYRLPKKTEQERGIEIVDGPDGEEIEQEVIFDVPGKELVAQYLAMYEMSGKPEDFANLVTYDYSTARMSIFIDSDKATVLTEIHDAVQGFLVEHFDGIRAQLTGMAELLRALNAFVIEGQAWSIATSLLLVLLITALMFRSVVLGLFATLPLFFSLFLNFGFMGVSGVPLNLMTMATSSVAIGVGIDYAIHFLHGFQCARHEGLDEGAAAQKTMTGAGVAIFLNALTVAAGFFALFFSQFTGVKYLGLLIALTMVTSAFAALTILPVAFATLKPRAFAGSPNTTEDS